MNQDLLDKAERMLADEEEANGRRTMTSSAVLLLIGHARQERLRLIRRVAILSGVFFVVAVLGRLSACVWP